MNIIALSLLILNITTNKIEANPGFIISTLLAIIPLYVSIIKLCRSPNLKIMIIYIIQKTMLALNETYTKDYFSGTKKIIDYSPKRHGLFIQSLLLASNNDGLIDIMKINKDEIIYKMYDKKENKLNLNVYVKKDENIECYDNIKEKQNIETIYNPNDIYSVIDINSELCICCNKSIVYKNLSEEQLLFLKNDNIKCLVKKANYFSDGLLSKLSSFERFEYIINMDKGFEEHKIIADKSEFSLINFNFISWFILMFPINLIKLILMILFSFIKIPYVLYYFDMNSFNDILIKIVEGFFDIHWKDDPYYWIG